MDLTTDLPQFLADIHARLFDPDRLPLAVSAILLVALGGVLAGPLKGNAQPFFWLMIDKLFGRAGDKLGNPQRLRADLLLRGFLMTSLVLLIAVSLGRAAEILTVLYPTLALPEILFLSVCLSSGALWRSLSRLHHVLDKPGSEKGVYYAIAQTSRTNLNSTDNYGITRMGMGLAARGFDKASVAPVVWYLIGGLPFVFGYTALTALVWRFGKNGFSKGFGEVPLALERVMGFVPGLLAGILLTMASIVTPAAGIGRSVVSWFAWRNAAPYAQGGLPLSVMAFALNISLGGPVQDLNGSALKNAWVGPKNTSAKVEHHHLRRGLYIAVIAQVFWVVALLALYLWVYEEGGLRIVPNLVP
jgi:adenosylcobinamide-phosphate synthase